MSEFPFEICGYAEDFVDCGNYYYYGGRHVERPNRPLGSDGRIEVVLTEPIAVKRNLKEQVIKASAAKPVKVWATLRVICGKAKYE